MRGASRRSIFERFVKIHVLGRQIRKHGRALKWATPEAIPSMNASWLRATRFWRHNQREFPPSPLQEALQGSTGFGACVMRGIVAKGRCISDCIRSPVFLRQRGFDEGVDQRIGFVLGPLVPARSVVAERLRMS